MRNDTECYQWPGNLAVDEETADVYVKHNTLGSRAADDDDDDVIVARVIGGAPGSDAGASAVVCRGQRPAGHVRFVHGGRGRPDEQRLCRLDPAPSRARPDEHDARGQQGPGRALEGPILVNHGPATTTFPWIVAGDPGKIDIVYYGTSEARRPSMCRRRASGASGWRSRSTRSTRARASGRTRPPALCTRARSVPRARAAPPARATCSTSSKWTSRRADGQHRVHGDLNTPPAGADPHQEWITFVQQKGGKGLYGK